MAKELKPNQNYADLAEEFITVSQKLDKFKLIEEPLWNEGMIIAANHLRARKQQILTFWQKQKK
jgi:hypothetical protein